MKGSTTAARAVRTSAMAAAPTAVRDTSVARVLGVPVASDPAGGLHPRELGRDARLAAVVIARERADPHRLVVLDEAEQPSLREGDVERRVLARPPRQTRGGAEQVVGGVTCCVIRANLHR